MYGCESWTVKKAERWRIDAFELWCWRRLSRVPWTARRSNQSILKEISPGYSLEGLMLKLKLQYFGHLMWRVDSLEETLMLGGIGGRRRRGWQRMRWLDGITESLGEFQELVMDRDTWRAAVHGVTKSWTGLTGWTELMLSPTLVFSDSLGLGGDLRVCISNKISDGIARDSLSVTSCKHWHVPTSQSQRLHQEWGHYGMMQNLTLLLLQRLHRTKIFAFAGLAVSRIYGCGVHGYKKKGICQRRKPM